ncbi:MAG: fn1 [Phycisphaerales bacterium]|nr:fn1 [Phycisphaerales bacterium]
MKAAAWIGIGVGAVLVGGVLTWSAGRFAKHELATTQKAAIGPKITGTEPANEAVEVSPVTGVKAAVSLPSGAGVDEKTLVDGVSLVRTRDGAVVDANLNSSGAGDDVVLVPKAPLDLGTQYTFRVTAKLKDTAGQSFDPREITFTTAKAFAVSEFPAAFEKIELKNTALERDAFTCFAIGSDHKLYAGTFAGMIHTFTINSDGTLTEGKPITKVIEANQGPRLITGLCFQPQGTPTIGDFSAEHLWVSHGQFAMKNGKPEGADDWTGKLSILSEGTWTSDGDAPTGHPITYTDVILGLPRAYKDHLNFQMAFGPDHALYVSQGSNTSVGDADIKWGYRPERKLTAAVLRIDLDKIFPEIPSPDADRHLGRSSKAPVNVATEGGNPYDPVAKDAPLTLYATGIRSGFHLLFHRNGHLYTGVNGAAGNEGNTPASPDGKVPAIRDIKQTTDDLLLKIEKGAYYGHPNPARGQYALNGANPTAGVDPMEVPAYPVGTMPDANWHAPAFVFGKNYSPNGLIDYHADKGSPAAALDGCLLVTRYSDGKDVLVLKLNDAGDVTETIAGLDGLTGLNAPLDIIQAPNSGNVYVAEYGGKRITLLRPILGVKSIHAQRTMVTAGVAR